MADSKEVIVKVTADTGEAETKIDELNNKIGDLNNVSASDSIKSFKNELTGSLDELKKIGQTLGKNSEQYLAQQTQIKGVIEKITNAAKTTKSFDPDNKLGTLVETGRKAAESVQKTTVAMKGLNFAAELGKDIFSQMKGVIAGFGFGLLIAGITLIIEKWDKIKEAIVGVNQEQEILNDSLEKGKDGFTNAAVEVENFKIKIREAKEGLINQKDVLDEFNKSLLAGGINVKDLNSAEELLINNAPAYIDMMYKKAAAQSAINKAAEIEFQIKKLEQSPLSTSFFDLTDPITKRKNELADLNKQLETTKKVFTSLQNDADNGNAFTLPSDTADKNGKSIGDKTDDKTTGGKRTNAGESQEVKDAKAAQALLQKIQLENEDFGKSILDKKFAAEKRYHDANLELIKKGNQDITAEMIRHNNTVNQLNGQRKDETIDSDKLTKDYLLKSAQTLSATTTSLQVNQAKKENDLSDAKIKKAKVEKDTKLQAAQAIGDAANALSDLVGQNTVAGKAFAIATATMDTFKAANAALASGPPPWNFVEMGAVIVQGLANVKKIVEVKVPNDNTSSLSASASAPTISAPQINATLLNPQDTQVKDVRVVNDDNKVIKAYISQKDLNDNQSKENFLNKLGRI